MSFKADGKNEEICKANVKLCKDNKKHFICLEDKTEFEIKSQSSVGIETKENSTIIIFQNN